MSSACSTFLAVCFNSKSPKGWVPMSDVKEVADEGSCLTGKGAGGAL